MELITKIIVLATALVGLYKAATFGRNKATAAQQESNKARKSQNPFSAFFELAGMLLFMLAFPAFLFGFMWIMGNISKAVSETPTTLPVIEINKSSTPLEIELAAAVRMSGAYDRDEQLKKIIEQAMTARDYETAIRAASFISSQYDKDEVLKEIISVGKSQGEQEGALPKKIESLLIQSYFRSSACRMVVTSQR